MAKKHARRESPGRTRPPRIDAFLWRAAALLLAFPAAMAALPQTQPWFTNAAAHLYPLAFKALSWLSLAGAAALALSPGWRRRMAETAEIRVSQRRLWLGTIGLGLAGTLVLLKYYQLRGGHLPEDTTVMANLAFNFNDRGSLESPILGVSHYFAVHFMPIFFLFAPLARLTHGPFPMLAAQGLAVAALPMAAYALAFRRTRCLSLGFAALWLVFTSPLFWTVARASLAPQTCLPALLLWGLFCAAQRRWAWAGILLLLAALCSESVPLTFFGLGLYQLGRSRREGWGSARLAGLALCAGALILFRWERHFIASFPDHRYWAFDSIFTRFGASPREVVANALRHPAAMLAEVGWPLGKLEPLWRTLWSTAFLGLLAPGQFLVFLLAFAPHMIAPAGAFYHDLAIHYPAYILGPLCWAMCAGLVRLHGWLARRGQAAWALVLALFFGGLNLAYAPTLLTPDFNPQVFWSLPVIAPQVPERASLWAVEYAAPWLAYRRNLKFIPGDGLPASERGLFRPDYVLLDAAFLMNPSNAGGRDRVLTYMQREGYQVVARTSTVLLLRHPAAAAAYSAPPAALPEADARGQAYGDALRALIPGHPL